MSAARVAVLGLWTGGLLSTAAGWYIPAKAALAQVLIARAWNGSRSGGEPVRPWPWAETWPVARLEVPRLGAVEYVLAGSEGSSLAFGPGHLDGSAPPGAAGNTVFAGHRDTHFRMLGALRLGDEVVVETLSDRTVRYRVTESRVVPSTDLSVLAPTPGAVLTLVTCYPLDATWPGGEWRYVVRAEIGTEESGAGPPVATRGSSDGAGQRPTSGRLDTGPRAGGRRW